MDRDFLAKKKELEPIKENINSILNTMEEHRVDIVDTKNNTLALKEEHNIDIIGLQNQIDNIVVEASESGDVTAEVVQARVDLLGINHDTLKDRIDNVERIRESLSNTNSIIFGEENPTAALEGETPMIYKGAISQDNEIFEDEKRLMIRYTVDGVRRYKLTNKNYLFRVIGYKDKVNNICESYNKDNILGKGEYTNEYINIWDNCIIIFKRVDKAEITNEDIANLYNSFSWAKPILNDISEEIEGNKEKIEKVTSILFGEEKPSSALTVGSSLLINATIYQQDGSIAEDNRRLMIIYTFSGTRKYTLNSNDYLFNIIGYSKSVGNIYTGYSKNNILGRSGYTNEFINTWDNCIVVFKRVDEAEITNEDIENLYNSFRWAKLVVPNEIENAKMTDLPGYAVNITKDGTNLMYVSKSETPNIRITAIELKKDVFINVKCENINRCRVGVKNSKMSTAIDNLIDLSGRTYIDNAIVNNDALMAYDFAYYNTAENATVFLYLTHGEEGVDPEITIDCDIKKYIDDNASTSKSPTYQAVDEYIIKDFEPFEQDYSASKGNGVTVGVDRNQAYQSTQPDIFLQTLYDPYVGVSDDGNYSVTKSVRGKDESGTWDIFEYDFCPKHYTKTILMTGGEHAYETPASFGLALWVKNLMENTGDTDLQWIKNNVRIKMIPMSNPWGFSQYPKSYGNCNGVNPNRNFDNQIHAWDKFPIYSPNPSDPNYNQWNYKGEYPFSEAETRIWRDWLIENKDNAEFWIDCHTGVYCTRADNWIMYQSTNPLIPKIKRAINALSRRIARVYDKTPTILEEVDKDTSLKISYGTDVIGIPTLVIEQADLGVPWWSEYYNSKAYITEYATTVHAYVSSLLMPE